MLSELVRVASSSMASAICLRSSSPTDPGCRTVRVFEMAASLDSVCPGEPGGGDTDRIRDLRGELPRWGEDEKALDMEARTLLRVFGFGDPSTSVNRARKETPSGVWRDGVGFGESGGDGCVGPVSKSNSARGVGEPWSGCTLACASITAKLSSRAAHEGRKGVQPVQAVPPADLNCVWTFLWACEANSSLLGLLAVIATPSSGLRLTPGRDGADGKNDVCWTMSPRKLSVCMQTTFIDT